MLTQAQLDQFHRDGYLIVRNVLPAREVAELLEAVERVQAEGIAGKGSDHKYHEHPDGTRVYRRSERMWGRAAIFQAVTVKPALLEMVGQCIGHPFLPLNDSLVCKLPGGNVPFAWHQDPPYGDKKRELTYEIPNFVTDLYLDESTVANGCVWAIPQHHLVGHVELSRIKNDDIFKHPLAHPVEMQPGDVLLHALSSPHGSAGNLSNTFRRIFYIHYMAKEVLENGYPGIEWMGLPGLYTSEGKAYARGMREARERLGFSDVNTPHVRWTEEGFVCKGTPTTPPRHWGKLSQSIPPTEQQAKKTLAWRG